MKKFLVLALLALLMPHTLTGEGLTRPEWYHVPVTATAVFLTKPPGAITAKL